MDILEAAKKVHADMRPLVEATKGYTYKEWYEHSQEVRGMLVNEINRHVQDSSIDFETSPDSNPIAFMFEARCRAAALEVVNNGSS